MSTQSKPLPQLTPFAAALAGALGGCFSTAVVYPMDVAKTRIQVNGKTSDSANLSMTRVILDVFNKEGFAGLYRGFAATMINTFSQQYAYFFFYSFVRNSYIKRLAAKSPAGAIPALSTATELVLGAIAGALAQIFTIPVSVIATRQQVGRSAAKSLPLTSQEDKEYDDSFLSVAKEIVEEEGVSGLWLGIKPGLVLTVNPAITYGVFERIKGLLLLARSQAGLPARLSPWMTFLVGALSKTLATVVTYPYIMAKVRIQARSADTEDAEARHVGPPPAHRPHHSDHSKHVGAIQILSRVWKREGFTGWYQGMQAQITKAVISQALLFLSKEQFERWAMAILLFAAKLR